MKCLEQYLLVENIQCRPPATAVIAMSVGGGKRMASESFIKILILLLTSCVNLGNFQQPVVHCFSHLWPHNKPSLNVVASNSNNY